MQGRRPDPFENLKLQVCIPDNNRKGSSYAAMLSLSRVPKTSEEDPLTTAIEDSRGIPPVIALITQGGVTADHCVIADTNRAEPTDVLMTLVKTMFPNGVDHPESYRFILVPLGVDRARQFIDEKMLTQINNDLKKCTMNYYDFENSPTPRLNLLGKISLPNPERYCEFSQGEDFTQEEQANLQHQRTQSALCVSHGLHPVAKFTVKMMDLVNPPKVVSVKYLKQTGEMVDLLTENFEKKLARSRGIAEFSFTSRLRISVLQNDFNEDKLPAPAWKFSFGNQTALSIQHDFHCLYNPKHPSLTEGIARYINENHLVNPMPPVYFAHIGAMNSYGVFAAEDIKGNTFLDLYAGDVTDDHPNPISLCYSFLLQFPGHIYSNNQAVYALDSGNAATLINSAPNSSQDNAKAPGVKANVIARSYIYKKLPLIAYYTMPGATITKGAQLFVDYEELLKNECPRHFSFFAKGTAVCAAAKNMDYCKEDHAKGRTHFAKKDFISAKNAFKTAYHLIKANYTQLPTADAAKLKLTFATICEDMADTYKHLGNKQKAMAYYDEALSLRKSLAKQTPANEQRLSLLTGKLQQISQEKSLAFKK